MHVYVVILAGSLFKGVSFERLESQQGPANFIDLENRELVIVEQCKARMDVDKSAFSSE